MFYRQMKKYSGVLFLLFFSSYFAHASNTTMTLSGQYVYYLYEKDRSISQQIYICPDNEGIKKLEHFFEGNTPDCFVLNNFRFALYSLGFPTKYRESHCDLKGRLTLTIQDYDPTTLSRRESTLGSATLVKVLRHTVPVYVECY